MTTNDNVEDVIAPKGLILPTIPVGSQLSSAPTGYIAISGASLVFFNGTDWKSVLGT